jgi:hypothetical protein
MHLMEVNEDENLLLSRNPRRCEGFPSRKDPKHPKAYLHFVQAVFDQGRCSKSASSVLAVQGIFPYPRSKVLE